MEKLKPPPFGTFSPENAKKGVVWETGGGGRISQTTLFSALLPKNAKTGLTN